MATVSARALIIRAPTETDVGPRRHEPPAVQLDEPPVVALENHSHRLRRRDVVARPKLVERRPVANLGVEDLFELRTDPSASSFGRTRTDRSRATLAGMLDTELTPERLARYWPLDPDVTFLNHGSFGACPWPVLQAQSEWRARMEREPVQFLAVELEGHLDHVRARLGELLHADPDDLALVPNATTGVNTVLRSLDLRAG